MPKVLNKFTAHLLSVFILAGLFLAPSGVRAADASNRQADVIKTSQGGLKIMPVYHGSVMLEFGGKIIHVDPWSQGDFTGLPQADMIVITHTHRDHLDMTMVNQLKKPETIVVGPAAVLDTLNCFPACGRAEIVNDSDKKTVMGIGFEGVPMYNLVQGSAPGMPYHHKGIGSGYILTFGDTRVYFSGDTECTPEMKALKNINVAFVSMNPPRTSSTVEAAGCVKAFQPKIIYPYHYRGSNLAEFSAALKDTPAVEVRIRKLEGEQ
jgi:L-ascorbate metabolism protein UlaG (beta-lactamase superfamily)